MENIALPRNVKFNKGESDNEARIIVEPCFPGYGVTLGNSVRRVLLSSLSGAAPVGIVIEGVSHEFTALPHLKEDILEFILNVKQLRLKMHIDETVILNLEVHGKKIIKASDIELNSQVEIVNPDLELGTITDMAGKINAKIYVKKGMGYVTIESREEKQDIVNYIEMDSIFSPIVLAGVKVENVRVGKMTNWDKLVLDLKTDGTITPKEAFCASVEILIKQLLALIPKESVKDISEDKTGDIEEKTEKKEEVEKKEKKEKVEKNEVKEKKKKRGRPKKS
ncbi:DNA-directed RNA polymerase subunit alpha [Candidatus Parcubacteria bacterium]|nr:DNA-directed RNA polymerase subunit alpha [Candidatus Parcubacteria bacterium]